MTDSKKGGKKSTNTAVPHKSKAKLERVKPDSKKAEQTEKELCADSDYFEKLINSMWDAVFSVKMPERVIEWANDSFRLIGYEPEECIGRTTEFLYPDEKGFLDFGNKLKNTIEAGKDILHTEHILKRKNGEIFPVDITTTIFREKDEVVRVTSIIRNITERKKAEQKIENLAKFPSENPYPVLRVAKDGKILYSNDAGLSLLTKWKSKVGGVVPAKWQRLVVEAFDSQKIRSQEEEEEVAGKIFSLVVAPVADSDYCNFYGLDITERKKVEQKIENLAKFPSENPYPVLRIRSDGNILYANAASAELLKQKNSAAGQPAPAKWHEAAKKALDSATVVEFEVEHQDKTYSINVVPVIDSAYCNFYGLDITERKSAESERELMLELLSLINSPNQMHELMKLVIMYLKDWSQCDAVGIRLQDGEDYPYFVTNGFSAEFILAENSLCSLNELGEPVRDAQGRPFLECMCGNIISGRFDPSKPYFTEHGSFWTNNTTELLASTTEADRLAKTRNRCNTAGYESLALIPLRTGSETFGLLQLNCKQRNHFTPEKILLFEQLADNLAIGLAQRKAEEALQDSENLVRQVLNATPNPIFVKDKNGRYILVNEADAELHDTTPEKMVGKTDFDYASLSIASRQEVGKFLEDDRKVIESNQPKFIPEETFTLPDGTTKWFQTTKIPVSLRGNPDCVLGVAVDITERKETEQALRISQRYFAEAQKIAHVGSWRWEIIPDEVYWSDEAYRLFDVEPGEPVDYLRYISIVLPEDRDFVEKEVQDALDGTKPYENEHRIVRNGEIRIHHTKGTATWDEQGRPIRLFGVVQDITERKKAEEELVRLNRILETMTSISQDMFRIKERQKLLNNVCKRIVKYAYKMVWIGFCDEKTKTVIPEAQAGFEEGYLESIKITYNDTKHAKGPTGTAIKTKKPSVMRCISTDPKYKPWREEALKRGYRSSASIPIFRADEVIGTLNVYSDKKDVFNDREVKLLEELTHDISTGLIAIDEETRRKQAEEKLIDYQAQLKSLASQLTLAEESERHRIAMELHASIGQSLVISKMKLDELRASVSAKELKKTLGEVCELLGKNIQESRTLTFDLSSPVLYELGFEKAVEQWLSEQVENKYGIKTEFIDDGQEKPLDDEMRVFLFRDMRELLFNVVKHARAKKVKVSVSKMGDHIKVNVEDDGWGFDPDKVMEMAVKKGSFGLFSIGQRLELLGGNLEIDSAPGHGTSIAITAPLKREN